MQLPEWSSGIGKHILKIEDGKSVVGNFRGEVVRFWQHWKGGRSIICPGREQCSLCASPDETEYKSSGRFRANFIPKSKAGAEEPVAMIFEGGRRVYEQLAQLNKDVPLEKAWVRISRTGTGKNTQITLAILPGDQGMVKPAQERSLLSVKLHDLSLNRTEVEEDVPDVDDAPEGEEE